MDVGKSTLDLGQTLEGHIQMVQRINSCGTNSCGTNFGGINYSGTNSCGTNFCRTISCGINSNGTISIGTFSSGTDLGGTNTGGINSSGTIFWEINSDGTNFGLKNSGGTIWGNNLIYKKNIGLNEMQEFWNARPRIKRADGVKKCDKREIYTNHLCIIRSVVLVLRHLS